MKKTIITPIVLSLSVLVFGALNSAFTKPKGELKPVQWDETTHNFGDIKMGPDAVAVFTFKNKSKAKLVVKSVEPGCSCTVSNFTADPVKKNKKGEVTATYKTEGKPGFFKKFIKVTFEDGRTSELIITGTVVQEPQL